jgi:hypothetical protein
MPDKAKKIDTAWEQLFERHDILKRVDGEGVVRISARQIREFHEARLMAKFDQSAQLPTIFRAHRISILPVTRGDYLIGPFDTHTQVPYRDENTPKRVKIPQLQTIDARNLYSEAAVLFFAYNSGIINDVMEDEKVHFTVNGRMGSGNFSFSIKNALDPKIQFPIDVKNSQIEIDAGFEGSNAFVICEAKNQASEELLIRQLYYPYRLWSEKISKPVIPVFLAFSNDVFHVFVYRFEDKQNYNSIVLKDYRKYTFEDEEISLQEVVEQWKSTRVILEPNETFPQADCFPRVLDLLTVLREDDLTRNEVTLKYEFDPRQTNYYTSACKYLGLIDCSSGVYRLTSATRTIMSLPYKAKHMELIKKILERPVFYRAFHFFIEHNALPDNQVICQIMKTASLPINDTTIKRRASTVRGWLEWMIKISNTE